MCWMRECDVDLGRVCGDVESEGGDVRVCVCSFVVGDVCGLVKCVE